MHKMCCVNLIWRDMLLTNAARWPHMRAVVTSAWLWAAEACLIHKHHSFDWYSLKSAEIFRHLLMFLVSAHTFLTSQLPAAKAAQTGHDESCTALMLNSFLCVDWSNYSIYPSRLNSFVVPSHTLSSQPFIFLVLMEGEKNRNLSLNRAALCWLGFWAFLCHNQDLAQQRAN